MRWRTAVIIVVAAWAMVMAIEVARGDEPPAAFPPGYPEAYRSAKANGRPLVIFVNVQHRPTFGADQFSCKFFPECDGPAVVVGVYNRQTGRYRRVDLPSTASDQDINGAHIGVREEGEPEPPKPQPIPLQVPAWQSFQSPVYWQPYQYQLPYQSWQFGGGFNSAACTTG